MKGNTITFKQSLEIRVKGEQYQGKAILWDGKGGMEREVIVGDQIPPPPEAEEVSEEEFETTIID